MSRSARLAGVILVAGGALLGVLGLGFGVGAVAAIGLAACVAGAVITIAAESGRSRPSAASEQDGAPAQTGSAPGPASRGTSSSAGQPGAPKRSHGRPSARPVAPLTSEPVDVVAAFAENARDAGDVLAGHLWLEDTPTATMRLIAASGPYRPSPEPVGIEGTVIGQALSSGSAVMRAESERTRGDSSQTVWRFAVPVEAGDARGVAAVDIGSERPDAASLGRMAADMRPALTGALAVHVARQESAAARVLLKTARELSRLVDPDMVVGSLLRSAVDLAGAQTGSVMLLDDDGSLSIAAATGLPEDVVKETRVVAGEGIAGWVLTTGQPLVVEDLQGRTPRSRRHGVRSAVAVPIADEDGLLGVLNVGSEQFHARFSPSHMDALDALGRIGAIALRNARAVESSRDLYFKTLKALALALETKDPFSAGATERILDVASELGKRVGLESRQQQALRVASLLHDVGMAAVGEAAAISDRPLSTVEWGLLKMHPVIAADVLAQAPSLHDAIPIVYHHHEHFDGEGYVVGIAGDKIPMGARVLAVADAFVAMTSPRPYRAALAASTALGEIRALAGSQFDPIVVTALEEMIGETDRSEVP